MGIVLNSLAAARLSRSGIDDGAFHGRATIRIAVCRFPDREHCSESSVSGTLPKTGSKKHLKSF
jgi:hypothetical protein